MGNALTALAKQRPVFYNEADFQHALAWVLHEQSSEAQLRLEIPLVADASERLDLLVVVDSLRLGIELKYPRDTFHVEIDDERVPYQRSKPNAIDFARYDIARDLKRLEGLVDAHLVDVGVMILLTNQTGLWNDPAKEVLARDAAFRCHEGSTLTGDLVWGEAGEAEPKPTVTLSRAYNCAWRDYSALQGGTGKLQFRSLLLFVG
jgi:hypothetical protein